MIKEKIQELLKDYEKSDVEKFASYMIRTKLEKNRATGKLKNPWMQYKTEEEVASLFERVHQTGLTFDGVHITLQSTGVSYDYIAYKNKMIVAYPDSKIDVSLVYEGDDFKLAKESGSVVYSHNIANPLNQEEANIIGGYCVIANKRGEFITLLSKADIAKHRRVAKTDYIWKAWFKEMALKTIIKKACKIHFDDIYEKIEEIDNDNYNLENPLELDLKFKQEIDAIETIAELGKYYEKNKGQGKDFDKYVTIRKQQLQK